MTSPNDPQNPYGGQQDPYSGQPQYGEQPDYGGQSGYPGYGYPSYGGGYGAPPQELPKGMAIAALVLGILGLVTFWSVIGGIILGLVGIILGAVAARKAGRGEAGGRGMAIAGLVVGTLGFIGGVIVLIVAISVGLAIFNQFEECRGLQGERLRQCIDRQLPGQQQSLGFDAGSGARVVTSGVWGG